jgi:hypothetical protein
MTRLAMIVDTINQDLIIPNVEKVAKLCADFKSGVETIFVSKDNKQEYIEIDDSVRQGDYKYTYSDNSNIALKSEKADLVVSAVERFAQVIPLNIQEIFLWYFEQKGVENPERFLAQGLNGVNGVNGNPQLNPELLQALIQNITQNQKGEETTKEENSQNVSQDDSENTQSSDLAALLTKLIGKENN